MHLGNRNRIFVNCNLHAIFSRVQKFARALRKARLTRISLRLFNRCWNFLSEESSNRGIDKIFVPNTRLWLSFCLYFYYILVTKNIREFIQSNKELRSKLMNPKKRDVTRGFRSQFNANLISHVSASRASRLACIKPRVQSSSRY